MNMRSISRVAGCLAAVAGFGLTAAQAEEHGHSYARVDVGASISASADGDIFNGSGFGNDFGTSPVFDLGGGMDLANMNSVTLRGEILAGYRPSLGGTHSAPNASGSTILSTKTSIETWTAMVNLYADFDTGSAFTPYVGVGGGMAYNRLGKLAYAFNGVPSAAETGTNQTNFAWSAMAGIGYQISEHMKLDFGYRYLDAGDVASSGTVTLYSNNTTFTQPEVRSKLHAHELTVGIRYGF